MSDELNELNDDLISDARAVGSALGRLMLKASSGESLSPAEEDVLFKIEALMRKFVEASSQ